MRQKKDPVVTMNGDLKVIVEEGPGKDGVTTYEHPSYGMLQFSRINNSNRRTLFGSSLDHHYTTVRLRIAQGRRRHHLKRDWYSDAGRLPYIEVEMSAAQFAEAITNMNVGSGVPCTVVSRDAEMIPEPPKTVPVELQSIRDSHARDMEEVGRKLREAVGRADQILSKKNLTKKDREDIVAEIRRAADHFASNQSFAIHSFQEAADKVVSSAKVEVDAAIQSMIQNAGIKSLGEGAESPPLLAPPADLDDESR